MRVLSDEEWLAVWRAADAEPPKLRAFVRLTLLCATRSNETAGISVGEVVSDEAIWRLPPPDGLIRRTKNGLAHMIPLGPLAQKELENVWPLFPSATSDFKLLGRTGKNHFAGQGKLLERLKVRSGVRDWSWHDLRRTARTGMTYLGVPQADAEAALNHQSSRGKLVAIYDQSGPSPSGLKALRDWQAYVTAIVREEKSPGEAERSYRSTLPFGMQKLSRPQTSVPRAKAKPGKKAKTVDWVTPSTVQTAHQ
jgi:integrase